jgi:S-(hydroxymethyl)glutathione dehydrogenase/alcohol dehydrogenase
VTKTYDLDGVNDGYDDMRAGKNIRGVMVYGHEHAQRTAPLGIHTAADPAGG